jgi:glucokinase
MRALAADLGGTHVTCAVVEDDRLLASKTMDSAGAVDLATMLPAMGGAFDSLLRDARLRPAVCSGVVLSFPGIVDTRSGRILATLGKYDDAPALDLAGWTQQRFGLPMRIENDARLALMGEHYAGAARGTDDAVMFTLGTGIGGTAMMHGKILRGAHAHAGSVGGHFVVDYKGRKCACGGIGCAEAEASGSRLQQIAEEWPGFSQSALAAAGKLNFLTVFRQASAGDAVAIAVRDKCLHVWTSTVVTAVNAYDPDVVVLGGAVMGSAAIIVPFVQNYVDEHVWATWGRPKVRAAELGNNAALLAAVPLLQENPAE